MTFSKGFLVIVSSLNRASFVSLILFFGVQVVVTQSLAQRRSENLGLGMNLSFLENWWAGTKEKHYSDFAKPEEAAKREKMFEDIAKAGFKTVRIPICFGAWMQLKRPYDWDDQDGLTLADSFVKWALTNKLNVIIDLHHSEFDGSMPHALNPNRFINLWQRIAERYKNTDPERVFFELRNEPHDISAEAWRWQANQIIKVVRETAPRHTLIVGFQDWNGRKALIDSQPFEDKNIIYTFHYYDPFLFTHQGATWVGENGIGEMKKLPFPAIKDKKITIPDKAKGKWAEALIRSYGEDSKAEKMFMDLKAAKEWSVRNKVPIFVGEFGSFGKFSDADDRCRHAAVVYSSLARLQIPNAWWEWDGGFSMFENGTTKISICMQKAIDSFARPTTGN